MSRRGAKHPTVCARIVAVAPTTDEQKPDWATAKRQATLSRAEDLTLLFELQNAGDKPLSLLGTRYGDSVTPPWPGKSASDYFAPLLFDCEFYDSQGRPLEGPSHQMLDSDAMGTLSGGLAETLQPTESLIVLLRPATWHPSVAGSLLAGEYRVRVRYHGPADLVLQKLRKTWPAKPLGSVWTGDVMSAEASFQIANEPESKRPELVWGEPVNGLRAAVEFRSSVNTSQALLDESRGEFPHGSRLPVYLHVRNVSEQAISFWSETWRQDDAVMLVDESGKETRLDHPWYSGEPIIERWTLKPRQTAVLGAIAIDIAADDEAAKKLEDPIGSVIIGKPGTYPLRYELRFNAWQTKDEDGRPIPGDGDWQGTISTGISSLSVRQRRPEDAPVTTKQPQPSAAAWGPASPNGIRLRIALEPPKSVYQLGEVVYIKLILENMRQQEQRVSFPDFDLDLRDREGKKMSWEWGGLHPADWKALVRGAVWGPIAPGGSLDVDKTALLLGGSGTANDVFAKLGVQPGQTCRFKLKLDLLWNKLAFLESNTVEFRVEAANGDRSVDADESQASEVRQQQDRDLEARRQAAQSESKEQETHTEARREALRAEIEQSARQGDQAAVGRHWLELIALTDPAVRDCRQAIQHFEHR